MDQTPSTVFETWQNRADRVIAQGALTNSKRPECLIKGVYPTHLTRGQGARVWDADGRCYIDFICGLGTNLLGYGHETVRAAAEQALRTGVSLSLGSPDEVRVAERVQEMFPFIDRVKFLKSGSDACTAAVRIARAATGRSEVFSEGYHGWHDEFVSLTPPASGVAGQHEYMLGLLDIDEITRRTAAVIVEPISLDASDARRAWLTRLRERCTDTGTMLIFDEVITGFRVPKYSVSRHWGVTPDFICLGKAIANGLPLALVGGPAVAMDAPDYFVSSTYAGDRVSLAAADATMRLLQEKCDIEYLWERGRLFVERFNSLYPEAIRIEGYPTRGAFRGDVATRALFWQEACRAGLLFGPSWFFNFGHVDLVEEVLSTCRDVITRIKTGSVKLEGALPVVPFAAKVRKA